MTDIFLALSPETKVVVVTGDNVRANALAAIRLGAYDFYQKPVEPDILGLIVDRAQRVHELELDDKSILE